MPSRCCAAAPATPPRSAQRIRVGRPCRPRSGRRGSVLGSGQFGPEPGSRLVRVGGPGPRSDGVGGASSGGVPPRFVGIGGRCRCRRRSGVACGGGGGRRRRLRVGRCRCRWFGGVGVRVGPRRSIRPVSASWVNRSAKMSARSWEVPRPARHSAGMAWANRSSRASVSAASSAARSAVNRARSSPRLRTPSAAAGAGLFGAFAGGVGVQVGDDLGRPGGRRSPGDMPRLARSRISRSARPRSCGSRVRVVSAMTRARISSIRPCSKAWNVSGRSSTSSWASAIRRRAVIGATSHAADSSGSAKPAASDASTASHAGSPNTVWPAAARSTNSSRDRARPGPVRRRGARWSPTRSVTGTATPGRANAAVHTAPAGPWPTPPGVARPGWPAPSPPAGTCPGSDVADGAPARTGRPRPARPAMPTSAGCTPRCEPSGWSNLVHVVVVRHAVARRR